MINVFTKFLKGLFKTGKKAKESIEGSIDFIDDVLEKEYITGSIDKIKETSGNIVESAGTVYQKTKDNIEDSIDTLQIKENIDGLIQKGKNLTSDISDNMQDSSATLKNVMEEGKKFVTKIFDEEE